MDRGKTEGAKGRRGEGATEHERGLRAGVDVVLLEELLGLEVHFAVHALHVARDVHLLLGAVHAVGALELRFLAALPLLVVAQRRLELVEAAAVGAAEAGLAGLRRQRGRAHAHAGEGQRQARRPLLPRQPADPTERHVFGSAAAA